MFCGFCFARQSQIWFSVWLCKQACWHRWRAGSSISNRHYSGRLRWVKSCHELTVRLCGGQPVLLSPAQLCCFFFYPPPPLQSDFFLFLEVWNSLWFSCKLWENKHIQIWMDLCRQSLWLMVLALSVPFEAVFETFTCLLIFLFSPQKLSNPFIASFPLHQGSRSTSWRAHLTTLIKKKHFSTSLHLPSPKLVFKISSTVADQNS